MKQFTIKGDISKPMCLLLLTGKSVEGRNQKFSKSDMQKFERFSLCYKLHHNVILFYNSFNEVHEYLKEIGFDKLALIFPYTSLQMHYAVQDKTNPNGYNFGFTLKQFENSIIYFNKQQK